MERLSLLIMSNSPRQMHAKSLLYLLLGLICSFATCSRQEVYIAVQPYAYLTNQRWVLLQALEMAKLKSAALVEPYFVQHRHPGNFSVIAIGSIYDEKWLTKCAEQVFLF